MIPDLKPYPAFIISGVPWLGEAPGYLLVLTQSTMARLRPALRNTP